MWSTNPRDHCSIDKQPHCPEITAKTGFYPFLTHSRCCVHRALEIYMTLLLYLLVFLILQNASISTLFTWSTLRTFKVFVIATTVGSIILHVRGLNPESQGRVQTKIMHSELTLQESFLSSVNAKLPVNDCHVSKINTRHITALASAFIDSIRKTKFIFIPCLFI